MAVELNGELIYKRLRTRRGQAAYHTRNPEMASRRKKVASLRDQLAWIGICPYCNQKCDSPVVDHFYPIARGGTDEPDNLVLCCKSCNSSKHKQVFILWLATRPRNNVEKYLYKVSHYNSIYA